MKKKLLVSGIVAFWLLASPAMAQPRQPSQSSEIKACLRAFVGALRPSALSSDFVAIYQEWRSHVIQARSPQEMANYVLMVEHEMTWMAMEPQWASIRDAWVVSLRQASTYAEVASALRILDAGTKWAAMDPRWSDVHDNWLTRLTAVEQH